MIARPLLLQRRFWPIWIAVSLGAFADNMLRQALIIGVAFGAIDTAGFPNPDDAIPFLGSFFAIAILSFSSIAGQIAEKYETSMLFRRIKFAEIILMAIAALGFFLNNGWILILVLFAMGAQSAFFNPVRMGAMPKYLRPDELVRGNGLCNAALYVSILLGLFMGGLFIARPQGGLMVAVFLLAASISGWLAILNAPRAEADAPTLKLSWNPLRQSILLARFVIDAPGVMRPIFGAGFFFFISTFVTVLMPLYARQALGADDAIATLVMGLFAIGIGIGASAAAALSKRRSGLGFSTLGVSIAAVTAFLAYFLTSPAASAGAGANVLIASAAGVALALAFCLCAVAMGLFVVPLQAASQRRAPAERRSRIMAAGNMANATGAILGSLSVLFITRGFITPAQGLLAVALLLAVVALYMLYRRTRVEAGLYDEMLRT